MSSARTAGADSQDAPCSLEVSASRENVVGDRASMVPPMALGARTERVGEASHRVTSPEPPFASATFAFSDIVGSTRFWEQSRDAMAVALVRHDAIIRAAAQRHRGDVFATGGDSFGVVFASPDDAVNWALDVHVGLESIVSEHGLDIKVRVGVHSGSAEERGGNYYGHDVNLTARISAAGSGGQTLLSERVANSIGVDTTLLGTFRLKDVASPQAIFQVGRQAFPALRVTGRPGNLGDGLGRLIGRDRDIDRVVVSLGRSRLTTVVGPGGIGKTRVGVEAARRGSTRLTGGGWMIEFARATDPRDVPRVVADTLGVGDVAAKTLTTSIVEHLNREPTLLLFDNCEHLVSAIHEVISRILVECPEVRVVATSRVALHLPEEQLIEIGPLDPVEASKLFVERARALDPDFDSTRDSATITQLCRALDGIPLAVELAAGRIRSFTPADMVERMDDQARFLRTRTSVGTVHASMGETIDWSFELMASDERALFTGLGVFVGWFDRGGVEAVCELDEVDLTLDALIDKSMVVAASSAFGRHFRLLEPLRQYALAKLDEAGETETTNARHAHWCCREIEAIGAQLGGAAAIDGVIRLNWLWDNLRVGIAWLTERGHLDSVDHIINAIALEIGWRGRNEIGDWAEHALESNSLAGDRRGRMSAVAMSRYRWTRDVVGAERLRERFGDSDDPFWSAEFTYLCEDWANSKQHLGRAVDRWRAEGDLQRANQYTALIASTEVRLGRSQECIDLLLEVAAEGERQSDSTIQRVAWEIVGTIALGRGDSSLAEDALARVVATPVPPGTFSYVPICDTLVDLAADNTLSAARRLAAGIRQMLHTDTMLNLGWYAGAFSAIASRLNLPEPAAVVWGWCHEHNYSTAYNPALARETEEFLQTVDVPAAAGQRGALATDREIAQYMDEVLKGYVEVDGPISATMVES